SLRRTTPRCACTSVTASSASATSGRSRSSSGAGSTCSRSSACSSVPDAAPAPREALLARLASTPETVAEALRGRADDDLARRADPGAALAAFERRRREITTLLRGLAPGEWARGGIHLRHGRLSLAEWAARLAAHDDNHLAQLRRALDGRV